MITKAQNESHEVDGRAGITDTAGCTGEERRRLGYRWIPLGVTALFFLVLIVPGLYGVRNRLLWWAGIPDMGLPFADLYVIFAGAAEISRGGNPYFANPIDPWGRLYNYPSAWMTLADFPLTAVPWVGVLLAIAFLIVVILLMGNVTLRQAILWCACLASPSVLLAVERANTDLVIFILLIGFVEFTSRKNHMAAYALALSSAVLKIYPASVFSFGVLGGSSNRRVCLVFGLLLLGLFAVQHKEITWALSNTPKGGILSYGASVWVQVVGYFGVEWGSEVKGKMVALSQVVATCLVFLGIRSGIRCGTESFSRMSSKGWCGIWVGSFVYLITFICGANFVYRCVFLLMLLPGLLEMMSWDKRARIISIFVLGMMLSNPLIHMSVYWLRECFAWGMLYCVAWLIGGVMQSKAEWSLMRINNPLFCQFGRDSETN